MIQNVKDVIALDVHRSRIGMMQDMIWNFLYSKDYFVYLHNLYIM